LQEHLEQATLAKELKRERQQKERDLVYIRQLEQKLQKAENLATEARNIMRNKKIKEQTEQLKPLKKTVQTIEGEALALFQKVKVKKSEAKIYLTEIQNIKDYIEGKKKAEAEAEAKKKAAAEAAAKKEAAEAKKKAIEKKETATLASIKTKVSAATAKNLTTLTLADLKKAKTAIEPVVTEITDLKKTITDRTKQAKAATQLQNINDYSNKIDTLIGQKEAAAKKKEEAEKKRLADEAERKRLAKEAEKKAAEEEKEKREKEVVKNIGHELKTIQSNLDNASLTLYGKEPSYDSKAVGKLETAIKSLETFINELPKKHEDLQKIINIEEKYANAWKESLNNIVKIAEKWHALFTDKDIDFKHRTATKEKIDYYGNEWYYAMKKNIQKYRETPKKFENIMEIKEHSVLLQDIYKEMLVEGGYITTEKGTLPVVYYTIGAYAKTDTTSLLTRGARLLAGKPGYTHPTFKVKK